MSTRSLYDLGFHQELDDYIINNQLGEYSVGRVTSEHRDRYTVYTGQTSFNAELIGHLRYSSDSRADLPAVGDWVAFSEYDDAKALIYAILPRKSIIERQAVGKSGQVQIIATNIDYALLVQAVDRDFNMNRLERYLALCNAAGVAPIIILNKVDLVKSDELAVINEKVKNRISDVPILLVSNESGLGLDELKIFIEKGKTYCLLGSSGVGKSTIVNNLLGGEAMKTSAISDSVHKGRHTTTHRELILLEGGGILIDNPGMREVGITDNAQGLEMTFDRIIELAQECRYNDCKHQNENGCAVLAAVDEGDIDEAAYLNYQKMEREKSHFEATIVEKRRKDREMGKMIKNVLKDRKKRKY